MALAQEVMILVESMLTVFVLLIHLRTRGADANREEEETTNRMLAC